MQSQEFASSAWAIGQRCSGVDEQAFLDAFNAGRIVRTHVLRPTWHLVAPADLRWMQALTAPRVRAAMGSYFRQAELTPALLTRCADLICAALSGGHQLTRKVLRDVLVAGGIEPGDTVRFSLMAMWCELEALVCSGAMQGRQHTYALVDERIPAAADLDGDEALGALARRYFASHAPAQLADFAWWSGLTRTQAARAVDLGGAPTDAPSSGEQSSKSVAASSPVVHLLPNFDEYVVAYQDRAALFPTEQMSRDLAGMGVLSSPVVLHRGQVAGGWKRAVKGGRVALMVSLRRELGKAGERALSAAAARYGRFLRLPVDVDTERTVA